MSIETSVKNSIEMPISQENRNKINRIRIKSLLSCLSCQKFISYRAFNQSLPYWATIFILASAVPGLGEPMYVLEDIDIKKDPVSFGKIHVILSFDAPPFSFPVYAMTDPERIIVDLVDTRTKESLAAEKSPDPAIENVKIHRKIINESFHTRVEIVLKKNTRYTANISRDKMIITLFPGGEIKKTVSLFKSPADSDTNCTIQSVDLNQMNKSAEIDVEFSGTPQSVSVYKMNSPDRIVMDFTRTKISEPGRREVNIAPVTHVDLIKRPDMSNYAGIVVHLKYDVPFEYKLTKNHLIVNMKYDGKKRSRKKLVTLVGAGVILVGGTATSILWGGSDGKGGANAPSNEDLGTPPPLPEN